MKVHFVYAVPAVSLGSRLRRKLSYGLGLGSGWVGTRKDVRTKGWPSYSPISITEHVYEELRVKFDTLLYDYRERRIIHGGKEDVLIGHPDPTDRLSIWNQSCEKGEFAGRIAMLPLHHGRAEVNAPLDRYISDLDAVLGIMGSYWFDTWEQGPLAHWKDKITRLDMAIDIRRFPRVKMRFNPPGKRKFIYVGNNNPCKGVHLLSILFGLAKNQACGWLGGLGGFPNLDCRRGFLALTPEFMAQIAEEYDFFITMGVSDANPTTILEAMAWGFPVCCTPQSGYYNMPEIEELSTTDMQHNVAVLNRLQQMPEEELLQRVDEARQLVETKYTWTRFNNMVVTELKRIAVRKGLITDADVGRVDAYSKVLP